MSWMNKAGYETLFSNDSKRRIYFLIVLDDIAYLLHVTGAWFSGQSVRLVVGRPGFNSLVESDQKT